jgi:hypothetical protein
MAIIGFLCGAVAVSVASALSVQSTEGSQWSMLTNLPRSALDSKHPDVTGCGADFEGYFKIDGLYWQSSFKTGARTRTACMQDCNEAKNCIGFTARKKNGAERLRCTLHKGLQQQMDHRAVSYSKCQFKGFACLNGFQFSHAGTWRSGTQIEALDDEVLEDCAYACRKDRGCVGFTHRESKEGDTFCYHFLNEENAAGPRRDKYAHTYAKCTNVEDDSLVQANASEDQQM